MNTNTYLIGKRGAVLKQLVNQPQDPVTGHFFRTSQFTQFAVTGQQRPRI